MKKWIATLVLCLSNSAFAMSILSTTSSATSGEVKLVVSPQVSDGGPSKLDLMFVIDNSASMDPFQAKLRNQASMLAYKLSTFSSIQVGVTSTDMDTSGGGEFVGTPAVLNNGSPNFASDLAVRLELGIYGSGWEQPLKATMRALSDELLTTKHAGFLRSDAQLALVFISDEPGEDSDTTTRQLVTRLQQLKGSRATVVGILQGPQCANSPSKNVVRELIQLVGGAEGSICDEDYASLISQPILDRQFVLERTIALPFPAKIDTIQVKYGQIELTRGNVHGGWIYNSISNSIVIGEQVDFASMPDANLEITYIRQ
ncbi:MAG: hypothetical protein AB7F86_04930 [Bdellovibrionales bacterium]